MLQNRGIKYFLSGLGNSLLKIAGINDVNDSARTGVSKRAPKIGLSNIFNIAAYWQGVEMIAGRLSTVSLDVMQADGKTVAERHPLQRLIKNGMADYYDDIDFIKVVITQMLTSGKSFMLKDYTSDGRITKMEFLDPSATWPNIKNGKLVFDTVILGDTVRSLGQNGRITEKRGPSQLKTYSSAKVFHTKWVTKDGINGISPLEACNPALQLALSSVLYGLNYFANDARPSTVLSPKTVLSKKQANTIVATWMAENGGINNRGVTVLPKGVDVHTLNVPPDESQAIGARMEGVRDAARVLNMPAVLLGDTAASTYNNVREAYSAFDNTTLIPLAKRLTSSMNRQLLVPPYTVRFDWESHFTAPVGERYNAYSKALAGKAFLLIEEIRKMEGLRELTPEEKDELLSYTDAVFGEEEGQEEGPEGQSQGQGEVARNWQVNYPVEERDDTQELPQGNADGSTSGTPEGDA